MKKLLLVLLGVLLLSACESRSGKLNRLTQNPVAYTKQHNHDIKVITLFEKAGSSRLYILKIDSIEYLVNHNGGIIELQSNK
tara:strand:+ start:5612 stop:5857 length:246 start_codon:yes stop_codon:yes gene_type:complete